ncbi:MAG: long-chain fatty acid--CoA ligase [Gammaproteobacteria bacterium]|nr:MAG: long-chain fatty acid--CoA ligase [Gammaproteobacteria bacterium]
MSNTQTIPQAFLTVARLHPDRTLVWEDGEESAFATVAERARRIGAALQRDGLRPGERVGLYCLNGLAFVESYLGVQMAGGVVVPINLLIGNDEISYILDDAEVAALLYHHALRERVAEFVDGASSLRIAACLGGQPIRPHHHRVDDWLAVDAEVEMPALDPAEDLAAILYTSGTTGNPKGAMLTHRNLVSNTASVVQALQLRPGEDRLLVVLPMFHAFAATVGMLTPALHGLTLVPVPRFDPTLVSEMVGRAAATVFLGVPSMYNLILRLPDALKSQWETVQMGVAGGAAMPVELLQRFEARFGFPILEGDGPTECGPVTCVNPPDGPRKPGSVGVPVPGVEMAIFDTAGRPLADGEIGEICVRGPNVMKGYWHRPEATAEAFFGEWFRTGDLGYRDNDGYFFMVDRIKDLIIVNGMNVYPRMVEETLYRHPDILEAAVVGEPHSTHGEIVVAHVVPREGAALDASQLRGWCRERLGPHQVPRKVIVRDALPKNATGKILKRELRRAGEIERGIDQE